MRISDWSSDVCSSDLLKWLDGYVRRHTINRFGPVRETDKSLVFEVAFDSVHESKRHKSGLAMRFPRINRIRTDKPAHEADRIETLRAMAKDCSKDRQKVIHVRPGNVPSIRSADDNAFHRIAKELGRAHV